MLEESEWDVNQHLLADCVFKYCLQMKQVLIRAYVPISLKYLYLNDEPRKIYKLIITAFKDQFLYIISTSADSDYVKLAIPNHEDMKYCHFLNRNFIKFHLHIKCKLQSFNGSSTICYKHRPKGTFYMADMLPSNIF